MDSSSHARRDVQDASALQRLLNALRGIASCATQCPCCEMHRRIAEQALADAAAELGQPVTGIPLRSLPYKPHVFVETVEGAEIAE